jgi:RNA polymerase sigma factor (sigma-70 family)
VWGAGYRVTRDADLARDVAQSVFTELARTANRLSRYKPLGGWLYRTAYHTAAKLVRGNVRRASRERQTMEMHSLDSQYGSEDPQIESLLPTLDETIAQLGAADREAIVLRFLQNKSLAEVGAALGMSDDAAQKRLSRALEKLRGQFRKRGVAVTGTALAGAMGAAAGQACPAGVAASVAASSLAAAGTVAAAGLGSIFSTIPTQLALVKTKLAIGALTVAGVATPLWIQQGSLNQLQAENFALLEQTAGLDRLREEHARLQSRQYLADEIDRLRKDHEELLALRDEAARLRANEAEEKARLQQQLSAAQGQLEEARAAVERVQEEIDFKRDHVQTVQEMKHLGLAARLYATENGDQLPGGFEAMTGFVESVSDKMKEQTGSELNLDRYEFMPHERTIRDSEPEMILFRERQVRRTPDGEWIRAYTLVDGSVQSIQRSSPGGFEEFERDRVGRGAHIEGEP